MRHFKEYPLSADAPDNDETFGPTDEPSAAMLRLRNETMNDAPRVSVLMPTFRQEAFIRRAVASLQAQSLTEWELIVVDDGSPDSTGELLRSYLGDHRILYYRNSHNLGLGASLNVALDHARAELVAYLPSDDVFYADHLASLIAALEEEPRAILAFSGVRHSYNRQASGQIEGEALQLVQVMHRRNPTRWMERDELVTDDLDRMYWGRLISQGHVVGTGRVTCEWVDHTHQRHKLLREPEGGLNRYRDYYAVQSPIRMHTSVGNRIDEVDRYRRFRERASTTMAPDGLRILLVGELAYNPERILALEERGHRLFGLWMPDPYWYNTVGPLPFGHVEDVGRKDFKNAVRRIRPDIIYALLNWQAVPWARHVMSEIPEVPFVWHYKEGPFIDFEKGTWSHLVELYTQADGQIYSSPEMRDWFETVVPGLTTSRPALVLDGDLPKRDWFVGVERSQRLSDDDGELHTVVPGRPIGLHSETVGSLAAVGVHVHFYGDYTHGQWASWIAKTRTIAPHHLHLHPQVDQVAWVREFSKYDAGWLHFFRSDNAGELRRANWDDLNYPARMATLALAGLPMLQADNTGSTVATQTLARQCNLGLQFRDMSELGQQLRDRESMTRLRDNVWQQRDRFTFDYHTDGLIQFFRCVIAERRR
jgi:glycosyltransferase involved in cell wall biosynthesis